MLPVVAAGRAERIASDHGLDDHVRLATTPGHSTDHFTVELGRGRVEGVITGDLIHASLHARYPDLRMR